MPKTRTSASTMRPATSNRIEVLVTGEPLLDTIANIAAGFEVAWHHLHDHIPSADFDRSRVSGSMHSAPPQRDPEVVAAYLIAQRAVRGVYHRLVAAGAPRFWASEPEYGPEQLIDPMLLCAVLAGIRRNAERADAAIRSELTAAERKLKPFWRNPPKPRRCVTCQDNYAAAGRRDCWTCAGRRRTKRQVRVSHRRRR